MVALARQRQRQRDEGGSTKERRWWHLNHLLRIYLLHNRGAGKGRGNQGKVANTHPKEIFRCSTGRCMVVLPSAKVVLPLAPLDWTPQERTIGNGHRSIGTTQWTFQRSGRYAMQGTWRRRSLCHAGHVEKAVVMPCRAHGEKEVRSVLLMLSIFQARIIAW
jgi:hypothetical protein